MGTVSLASCQTYDPEYLREVITRSLTMSGFDLACLKGRRVCVKPNLLSPAPPEAAVTTHPEFFRAVVRLVRDSGGMPVLIESPANVSLERVLKKTPFGAVVAQEGIEVAASGGVMPLHNTQARTFRHFEVAAELAGVDVILNLPKLKTHGITYISGALKNLFGLIPGLRKSQWHMRAQAKDEFAEFLLDFYGALLQGFEGPRTIWHIMDAVVGMEGEGPGNSGTPRQIGAVIAGRDAVAVDFVALNVLGLDAGRVRTVISGAARGLGAASWEAIELAGVPLEEVRLRDFVPTRASFRSDMMKWPLNTSLFRSLLVEKPRPDPGRCTLCYQCRQICPAGAITHAPRGCRVPAFDYRRCVRCYCCMEVCPEAAITLRPNLIRRLMA